MKYPEGNSNHILFTDTNHSVKNCRYQLVGGYCAYVIGLYCFDPWLLKMTGVSKELVLVEVFSFDSAALWLVYLSATKKCFIRYI